MLQLANTASPPTRASTYAYPPLSPFPLAPCTFPPLIFIFLFFALLCNLGSVSRIVSALFPARFFFLSCYSRESEIRSRLFDTGFRDAATWPAVPLNSNFLSRPFSSRGFPISLPSDVRALGSPGFRVSESWDLDGSEVIKSKGFECSKRLSNFRAHEYRNVRTARLSNAPVLESSSSQASMP